MIDDPEEIEVVEASERLSRQAKWWNVESQRNGTLPPLTDPLWEKQHRRVYFLQRWPSTRAMQRVRQRVKGLTLRAVCHRGVRDAIACLNPVLRGWGAYFRTGNAAIKFGQVDDYVNWRLKRLLLKRHGRHFALDRPPAGRPTSVMRSVSIACAGPFGIRRPRNVTLPMPPW